MKTRTLHSIRSLAPFTLICIALSARAASAQQPAQSPEPAAYAALSYRHIGPVGNRISAVAGVPGDPHTYYAGAASGGVWKTTDGGLNWVPLFDDQPVSSIGSLAVAPSDPNIVWAGTGEPHIRSHISAGWGIYKSTDAGKTWARMGLENTGRISRVVVHPANPDIVYAAAQGHCYGPQEERGIFRTTDGGKTWDRVLFVDKNTGASDLIMSPGNPRILFAGMWQIEIHTWGRESGGPGSGIFVSRDGGTTWNRLQGRGLPAGPVGKIGLGISRSNPDRVYALVETSDGVPWQGKVGQGGELWSSDDCGENWRLASYDRQLGGRTHYYNRMAVAPDDEDEAYFLAAAFSKTVDGGRSTIDIPRSRAPGWDHHDMWIDPGNAGRMVVAHDGGVSISTTRGRSWFRQQLPIAQMYHVTVDNRIPYWVYGNKQDGPSYRGPSNSKLGRSIPRALWHSVGGGECGWATPDPSDPNFVWSSASGSGSRGGIVTRYDLRTGIARNVEVWPVSTGGWPAADLKYRFSWTFPLTISPHDQKRVYAGSQHVHVTSDGGNSWQVISPDLSLNDKSRQQISGGLTPDNIGVEYAGAVFAIAESRLKAGLIWAGTNDGRVHVTRDGGRSWTDVTANLPNLPPWGTISNIEPSRYLEGAAYLTADFHQVNDRNPYVYKTRDWGMTWTPITAGIPPGPLSYAHVIREDPVRPGLLYLGTENALYLSFDDGEHWQPLQNNLPQAPVYWITIQEHFNDLVVATYGRGFWILDDLTPLQQWTSEAGAEEAHFFVPRTAYRFREMEPPATLMDDLTEGQNPPYGASISYWLKSPPQDDPALTILDPQGRAVRSLKGSKRAGINRVWWDLRFEPSQQARIRVSPLYAPEVEIGPEGMAAPRIGRISILAPPGTYTVRLTVGEKEYTQPLEVRMDPNSGGSLEGIQEQTALLREIQAALSDAVDMVNGLELARYQLSEIDRMIDGDTSQADLRAECASLAKELLEIEEELHQVRLTGRGQDSIRWPLKLAGRLEYLASGIAEADFPPTTQARAAFEDLNGQLKATRAKYDRAMERRRRIRIGLR